MHKIYNSLPNDFSMGLANLILRPIFFEYFLYNSIEYFRM